MKNGHSEEHPVHLVKEFLSYEEIQDGLLCDLPEYACELEGQPEGRRKPEGN